MTKQEKIEDLFETWSAAGGTAAHPAVKKQLFADARSLGVTLPGMKGTK